LLTCPSIDLPSNILNICSWLVNMSKCDWLSDANLQHKVSHVNVGSVNVDTNPNRLSATNSLYLTMQDSLLFSLSVQCIAFHALMLESLYTRHDSQRSPTHFLASIWLHLKLPYVVVTNAY
jgi:hypothetical protein